MTSATGAEVPTSSDISELLMLKEIPRLAAIVTIIAQPFGQFREHFGDIVPEAMPLAVAALCSVLLAFFLVRSVKHTTVSQAAYTIPLIALIVFSGSLGANNVVDVARGGSQGQQGQGVVDPLSAAQPQIKDIEEHLKLEQRKTYLLREALGLPPESDQPTLSDPSANAAAGAIGAVMNVLIAPAYGQQATTKAKTAGQPVGVAKSDPALVEKQLQELDRQTRLLQSKRDNQKSKETNQVNRPTRPLWKSW